MTKPFMLFLILAWAPVSSWAKLTEQGYIRVNMKGSIIDTPCNIAGPDDDQVVRLGIEPLDDIVHNGRGTERKFSIHLINCTIKALTPGKPDSTRFQITFDGKSDGKLFGVDGDAAGVGLQIIDSNGNVSVPGQPLPTEALFNGTMQLDYILRLMGDHHHLRAGSYHSTIRFKVEYN